jgi:hypothetical protein
MRTIDPLHPDGTVRFAGVLDVLPTPDGAVLSRLSPATHRQITDPVLRWTASMPSGARIELVSDTTTVEVEVMLTRLAYGDDPPRAAAVDLVVDGDLADTVAAGGGHVFRFKDRRSLAFDVESGPPSAVRFEGLPAGDKHLELWLPANASVAVRAVRIDDGASLAAPPDPTRRWVHYGSSISHCAEAEQPTGVWPAIVARREQLDLLNLAVAGQCHLDQFVARTIRDLPVDLISLKVGINVVNGDTLRERTFVPAVHGFLDTVRDGHPHTPLVVVSPIICPVVEDHPGPTVGDEAGMCRRVERAPGDIPGALTLRRIRDLLAEVVLARRTAGDEQLHYLSGLELFDAADLDHLPDGLHPDATGYARIADRFQRLAFGPDAAFRQTERSSSTRR